MKHKRLSFATRYVLIIGLLMLFANALLGGVILYQSDMAMTSLIHKNMLDVVETAAALMDGDVLGALTEADVDGEAFRNICRRMLGESVPFQHFPSETPVQKRRGIWPFRKK